MKQMIYGTIPSLQRS